MNKKLKVLTMVLSPAFLIGLASCHFTKPSSTSIGSSTGPVSSGPDTTSTPPPVSSTSGHPSSSLPVSSTSVNPDVIPGTPETRRAAYETVENGDIATFYAQYVKAEIYASGGTANLYFMDGHYAYRVINVKNDDLDPKTLEVGKVYKVIGEKKNSAASNPSTTGKDLPVVFTLIPGGDTTVSATVRDLTTEQVSSADQFSAVKFTDGIVKTVGQTFSVTVGSATFSLSASNGTVEELSVKSKLGEFKVGQKINLKLGLLDKNNNIKVLSPKDVTAGEEEPDYVGTIAQDAGRTGAPVGKRLTADINGSVITFGRPGEVIAWYEPDAGKGWNVAANRVGVELSMPADAVRSEITVKVGNAEAQSWDSIGGGAKFLTLTPTVTKGQDIEIAVVWKNGLAAQTFKIKISETVKMMRVLKGEIAPDDDIPTGSVAPDNPLAAVVTGNSITFGGQGQTIAWYPASTALNRTEGNYVGISLKKPEEITNTSKILVSVGTDVSGWPTGAAEKTIYLKVSRAEEIFDISVVWADDTADYCYPEQNFQVRIAALTKLQKHVAVSGTVELQQLGTETLTLVKDSQTYTVGKAGEIIPWYQADDKLAAGYRIGLKLTRPVSLTAETGTKITLNGKVYRWSDIVSTTDPKTGYLILPLTKDQKTYELSIVWAPDSTDTVYEVQNLKIVISSAVTYAPAEISLSGEVSKGADETAAVVYDDKTLKYIIGKAGDTIAYDQTHNGNYYNLRVSVPSAAVAGEISYKLNGLTVANSEIGDLTADYLTIGLNVLNVGQNFRLEITWRRDTAEAKYPAQIIDLQISEAVILEESPAEPVILTGAVTSATAGATLTKEADGTYTIDGIIPVTASGEKYLNRLTVEITKPAGAASATDLIVVDTEIGTMSFSADKTKIIWTIDLQTGLESISGSIKWNQDTGEFRYPAQTIKIKPAKTLVLQKRITTGGTLSAEDITGVTVTTDGTTVTVGKTGEFIPLTVLGDKEANFVGFRLTKPAFAVEADISVLIDGVAKTWAEAQNYFFNITEDNYDHEISVTWGKTTAAVIYVPQVFKIKVAAGLQQRLTAVGKVEVDSSVGAIDDDHLLTSVVSGSTVTIGAESETVAYYPADGQYGKAGHYVGIKITKPDDCQAEDEIVLNLNGKTSAWPTGQSAISLDLLVTEPGQTFAISISWGQNTPGQVYTTQKIDVKVADGVKLEKVYSGTIAADKDSELNSVVDGGTILIGGPKDVIPWFDDGTTEGNYVTVNISKPADLPADADPLISYQENGTTVSTRWSELAGDADSFEVSYLIQSLDIVHSLKISWTGRTADRNAQVFTVKIAYGTKLQLKHTFVPEVSNPTAGISFESVDGVYTYGRAGEAISWDEELQGNYIALKIARPFGLVANANPVLTYDDTSINWNDIRNADGSAVLYLPVSALKNSYVINIKWNESTATDLYEPISVKVAVAAGVKYLTLLDEIKGTAADRYQEFVKAPVGKVSVYAEYVVAEEFSTTVNLYFMDGVYGYNCVSISSTLYPTLNLVPGQVYKITGSKQKSGRIGSSKSDPLTVSLIADGSDKIKAEYLDLAQKVPTDDQKYFIGFLKDGLVTAKSAAALTVKVGSNSYKVQTRDNTVGGSAVLAKLALAEVGQYISVNAGVIYSTSEINVYDPDAIELGYLLNGAIAKDETETLTSAVSDSVLTLGAPGEKIASIDGVNRVGIVLNAPKDIVVDEATIEIDGVVKSYAELGGTSESIFIKLAVEPRGLVQIKVQWRKDTPLQNFEVRIVDGVIFEQQVAGSISADRNADVGGLPTGSVDIAHPLSAVVDDDTITFGGSGEYIAWYGEDTGLGRSAGNRVGVQIKAPTDLPAGANPEVIINGNSVGKWQNLLDGSDYFWWYPLITADNIGVEQKATIKWLSDTAEYYYSEQTFTVKIAAGTVLQNYYDYKGTVENAPISSDLSFRVVGSVYTYGGPGQELAWTAAESGRQAGYYIGVLLTKPEGLPADADPIISYEGRQSVWSDVQNTVGQAVLVLPVTAIKRSYELKITWYNSDIAAIYEEQTVGLALAPEVKFAKEPVVLTGTVGLDTAIGGALTLEKTDTEYIVGTVDEEIKYYTTDFGQAGNYFGLKIAVPEQAIGSEIEVRVDGVVATRMNLDGGYLTLPLKVDRTGQMIRIEIDWKNDTETQTFITQVFEMKVTAGLESSRLDPVYLSGTVKAFESDLTWTVETAGKYIMGGVGEIVAWNKEAGRNEVQVQIDKPEGAVEAEIEITAGGKTVAWPNGSESYVWTIAVDDLTKEYVCSIVWAHATDVYSYPAQVITVKFAEGTILQKLNENGGTVFGDPNSDLDGAPTGSIDKEHELAVTVDGNTITLGSAGQYIAWYEADPTKGRTEGNRVGVQINKPDYAVENEIRVMIGSTVLSWDQVKDGDGFFWYYPLVTAENREFKITVHWADDTAANLYTDQTFTIRVGQGTILQTVVEGSGTIIGDPNSDLAGAPTGSVDKDHPLTTVVDGSTITFGGSGEAIAYYPADPAKGRIAGNRVGVQINKPEYAVDKEITVTIGSAIMSWDQVKDGDGFFWFYPLVTAENRVFTVTVHWADDTLEHVYHDQVFTIKVAPEATLEQVYSGTVTGDPNSDLGGAPTGSVDKDHPLTTVVDGNTITFGGLDEFIAYYKEDLAVGNGRQAGNRVGVQINKPTDLPAGVDPLIFIDGIKIGSWSEIADGDDYLWWYPLVKDIADEYRLTVHWSGRDYDLNAETFTVRIAEGTKLQSSFLTQDPTPISIAEASAVKTSDFETLYVVEGIVESITSIANGQGYIIDPSTGKKLMFFHLGTDSSMFNTYDPSSGIYPDADPGFNGLGLAVGDKITVHGIMYVYKSTPEIVGWCQDIVKKEAVDYDLTSEITVPEGIEASLSYFDETGAKVTKTPADRTLTLKVEAPVGCYVKSLKFGGKTVTPNEDGTYTVKSIIGINKAVVEIAEASKYVVEITNGTIDKGTVTVVDSDGHTGTTTVDGVTTIESYEGALITVTVNPTNESFVLNKLTLDGEDVMDRVVERKLTFPVSKAHTLNVEFVQNKVYGIALKPGYEKGIVSVDKNSANLNEKVTVTMTPDRSETSVITVSSVLINKLKADGTVLGTDDLTAAVVETETSGVFEVTFVATDITDLASYEIVVVFTEMIEKTSVYKICEDKYNSSISGSIPTNFGQFIQTGTDIITGVATSGSCAWSAGNPLKFGTANTPATKLTLSLATKVSKVSVRACSWSKETAVITVNGVSLTLNKGTGSATDYQTLEFTVNPSDRIEISNSGSRYLISQLEFNYLAVPAAPHAVYSTVYGSGTVLLNDENVDDQIKMLNDGEQAVFTITPAEYYYIEKFTINDESMLDQLSENAGYYTYTLDAVYEDLLVDVKFAEMSKYSFTIQANDTSMGTATMSVDGTAATDILTDVYQNTPITIDVTPQSGYVFSSLKLIDYSTSEPVPATFVKVTDTQYIFTPDFTADGDYEILAVFAAESEIEIGATYKWAPSAKLSNTVTSGALTWDIELTGKGTFGNMDSTKGAQIGSSKSPVDTATFMTADYVDGITKVTVNTAGASSVVANIQVFVGDVELECEGSNALTTSNKDYVFTSSTVLTGTVKIIYTVSAKAIYFKSVTIN